MKYIIVGGSPFRSYTGTTTFTALKCLGATNNPTEVEKILKENYDECGGLIAVFDSNTGEYPDDLPESCQFAQIIKKAS